ncbi:MAG TPA: MoxR family ATPase [Blastocatellia bacterium]|nr:MoxR family ATPase [Blastocatellia bacterium]
MLLPYYTGKAENHHETKPASLPVSRRTEHTKASGYRPDSGLVDAVNVALILAQPLLLTGEPGTGKTQLAYSVSWELGYGDPLVFETKSTSVARDLFYTYYILGRFHAAQLKMGSPNELDYITYNALGKAILRANSKEAVQSLLPDGFEHNGPRRSVVLIDEIDKAPRDFPNDLLNEVDNMQFKIPELGLTDKPIVAPDDMRPILIITSNSEKHLPDAFLRRCIYYDIPFPTRERLIEIVESRIERFKGSTGNGSRTRLMQGALDFFFTLRRLGDSLRKQPATAELLGWLTYLTEMGAKADDDIRGHAQIVRQGLSTLVKSAQDQEIAKQELEEWLKRIGHDDPGI